MVHEAFGWVDPQILAEMQEEQAAKAKEAEVAKSKEAKRTTKEKREEAKKNCEEAGRRLATRVTGMIGREAGRLIDMFEILFKESSPDKVEKIVWKTFMVDIDKAAKGTKKKQ